MTHSDIVRQIAELDALSPAQLLARRTRLFSAMPPGGSPTRDQMRLRDEINRRINGVATSGTAVIRPHATGAIKHGIPRGGVGYLSGRLI